MEHKEWLQKIIAPDSMRAASKKIGKAQNYLAQALKLTGELQSDVIIAICREYRYPVLKGLQDVGIITPQDFAEISAEFNLQEVPTYKILSEIERRITNGASDSDMFTGGDTAGVIDLDAARMAKADPPVADFDPATYTGPMAADSSPDEPGPGDEGYHDGP